MQKNDRETPVDGASLWPTALAINSKNAERSADVPVGEPAQRCLNAAIARLEGQSPLPVFTRFGIPAQLIIDLTEHIRNRKLAAI